MNTRNVSVISWNLPYDKISPSPFLRKSSADDNNFLDLSEPTCKSKHTLERPYLVWWLGFHCEGNWGNDIKISQKQLLKCHGFLKCVCVAVCACVGVLMKVPRGFLVWGNMAQTGSLEMFKGSNQEVLSSHRVKSAIFHSIKKIKSCSPVVNKVKKLKR